MALRQDSDSSESKASDNYTHTTYAPINVGDRSTLSNLARRFSQQSAASLGGHREDADNSHALEKTTSGLFSSSTKLDPTSPSFDLDLYLKRLLSVLDAGNVSLKSADVSMRNVNVSGSGAALTLQQSVTDLFTGPFRVKERFAKHDHKQILRNVNIHLKHGELLVVLGRPGAGCSTLLKAMTGEMHGLMLDEDSSIDYSGIPQSRMMREFKGEAIYNQEVDRHFPHLTVGQTLEHAAALRLPRNRPGGTSRPEFIDHIVKVVMAVYGLSHTYNTKVGDDFVRGVSGGERKRVSIAEMALACSPISAWDNSTRGLDSAAALKFVQSLRTTCDLLSTTTAVAIYQASQSIYDLFDKATVLYEGRQIYFGPADEAKAYFEDMGWLCPDRQTTGDFITSITNPIERVARPGYENRVPRTPEEFETYWTQSRQYADLIIDLDTVKSTTSNGHLASLRALKEAQQAKGTRSKSPYLASINMQVKHNLIRAVRRAINDPASTFAPIATNIIMALIIGSVFYNTPQGTQGFSSFNAALFFAILLNALGAIAEIATLYAQRPIVEKHKSYAMYHPWTEAMAGIVLDIPIKFVLTSIFSIILYFLVGLRRAPSNFFIFLLINYTSVFIMAAIFRTMAAVTKTISQAMALAGVLVLAIVTYTGYTLPTPSMHPWLSWIRFINPIFYGFEILVANQFHAKDWTCSAIVPAYPSLPGSSWICSAVGAVPGEYTVNGDVHIQTAYGYTYSHVWRNFGILWAFLIAFMVIYFVAVELNSSTSSTAEALVFRRGHAPSYLLKGDGQSKHEPESGKDNPSQPTTGDGEKLDAIAKHTDVFSWRDVVLDITIKGEPRRLLDNVSGWIKPGTLTALMGSSGAGKTTLLDSLAQRTTIGVLTGDMLVNGAPLDASFARKTGYVQQQDLHLATSTVRESLRFSAMLRQPATTSKQDKFDYVESVIQMLGMQDFAEAVVGVPGEGLNVEQRKLLTIGVELAAKPKLLLFLDEPTSGLDSQSSWAICAFLRKLADAGQAVLCTIHQPSAVLFQQFDRLLFLRKGGQTVYFGDVGQSSRTLLDYFEHNGARTCGPDENPAEYMLEIANDKDTDWHSTWKSSAEYNAMMTELDRIQAAGHSAPPAPNPDDHTLHSEFAVSFSAQFKQVLTRVFQQYWRTPSYISAKLLLCAASGLFIGFSFYHADPSQQGMQNVLFSLFMVCSIFSTVTQQIQPMFVTQRELYEVRERPSRAYSWQAFVLAQIVVEIPWQILSGVITFATFYYPVVGTGASSDRQVIVLLYCIALFVYASTFAQMVVAALPDAATAASITVLLFAMSLIFCGVIQPLVGLPGFWTFMYRLSFFTYWVGGVGAAMLWGREVVCSAAELSVFDPPAGLTCGAYLEAFTSRTPGRLLNPQAVSDCSYCALSSANTFLEGVNIAWSDRWRNFGIQWGYVVFNIVATIGLYWFFRARKMSAKR